MRRSWVLATLLALVLLVMQVSATPPSATAEADIPWSCSNETLNSDPIAGDDFNPDTPTGLTWQARPANSFTVKQHADAQDSWQVHSDHPAPGTHAEYTSQWITLPHGRQISLHLRHAYSLAPRTEAQVHLSDEGGGGGLLFDGHSWSGFSGNSYGYRVDKVDISEFAGKRMHLAFVFVRGDASPAPTPSQTGWDIDDLSIHTCDDASPSGPDQLVVAPGYTAMRATWQPPAWRPELVTGYQARLIDLADSSRNRVVDLGPDARTILFSELPTGRDYRVEVSSGRYASTSRVSASGIGMTTPLKQILQYPTQLHLEGPATCGYQQVHDRDGRPVLVQRRPIGASSWSYFRRAYIGLDDWYATDRTTRNMEYRALFEPGTYSGRLCRGSISKTVKAYVRPYVTPGPGNYLGYCRSEPVKIWSTVRPAHPGMRVYLQRYYSGAWRNVTSRNLDSSSNQLFKFYVKIKGNFSYRVKAPGHSDHLTGTSATVRVKIFC
jgi:hypothetical protein